MLFQRLSFRAFSIFFVHFVHIDDIQIGREVLPLGIYSIIMGWYGMKTAYVIANSFLHSFINFRISASAHSALIRLRSSMTATMRYQIINFASADTKRSNEKSLTALSTFLAVHFEEEFYCFSATFCLFSGYSWPPVYKQRRGDDLWGFSAPKCPYLLHSSLLRSSSTNSPTPQVYEREFSPILQRAHVRTIRQTYIMNEFLDDLKQKHISVT